MKDNCLVQIRVDKQLKNDAAAILDDVGLDIPTAVRMFLKTVVREKGLPLDIRSNASSYLEAPTEQEATKEPLPATNGCFSGYHMPDVGADEILLLPRDYTGTVSTYMYVQLICRIPRGRVARSTDIEAFLKKAYGLNHVTRGCEFFPLFLDTGEEIPYWRVLTHRGLAKGWYPFTPQELQHERLIEEGHSISMSGPEKSSPKVDHYKELIYDFSDLKIVDQERNGQTAN